MDIFVTFVAQPLISTLLLGVIVTAVLLLRDFIMFLTRRQIGYLKVQFAVLNWKDDHLDSVERDAFDREVELSSLYGRYLLLRLLFITAQNKTEPILTFGKLTESIMRPIRDFIAPAGQDGTLAQIRRQPYQRLTFWMFVMNDTYDHDKTRMLRVILVRDEDIQNLPRKCSHSSRNFNFLKAAKLALEKDPAGFSTVEIKIPA